MTYGRPPHCAGTSTCPPPNTYTFRTDTAIVELWVLAWVAVAFLALWIQFRRATAK